MSRWLRLSTYAVETKLGHSQGWEIRIVLFHYYCTSISEVVWQVLGIYFIYLFNAAYNKMFPH